MSALASVLGRMFARTAQNRTKKSRNAVLRSSEFMRVRDLPRRIQEQGKEADDLAEALTDYLKTPDGTMSLRALQALMLIEAKDHNGILSSAPVGSGKTIAAVLFPVVMESKRCVILCPPNVKRELETLVIPMVQKNFRKHDGIITVLSYHELSSEAGVHLLFELDPDLIVCDEVHLLKRTNSARTRRFLTFFKEKPRCRLVAMSGTITTRSLRDFGHIIKLTHPFDTPLPREWRELQDWAQCVDAQLGPNQERLYPGALLELCAPGETAAQGVGRRLLETHGFVAGRAGAIGTSLIIERVDGPGPDTKMQSVAELLRDEWETPHEVLADGAKVASKLRELSHGFYYRWDWPDGKIDHDWMDARLGWARYCREVIKRGVHGLDTEKRVRDAVADNESDLPRSLRAEGVLTLAAWDEQSAKPWPPTVPVWLSTRIIDFAEKWMKAHPRGIVWYYHQAVGDKLRERGLNVYAAGPKDSSKLLKVSEVLDGTEPGAIACSYAHGTGKNLQYRWNENLFLAPPSNGAVWEQTMGRTHRPKQEADEVKVEVLFTLTAEAYIWFHKALTQAKYIEHVSGTPQKLLYSSFVGLDSLDAMRLQKTLDAVAPDMVSDANDGE